MKKLLIPFLFLITSFLTWGNEISSLDDVKKNQKLIQSKYLKEEIKLKKLIKESETVAPEEFPEDYKKTNFKIFGALSKILINSTKPSPESSPQRKLFLIYREKLSNLEYQESKVEKIYDLIQSHFKNLEEMQYRPAFRFFIDYISWQYDAVLKGPSDQYDLVVTNKGICPGASYSQENKYFSFFVDACYLFTSGGVSSDAGPVTYVQDNVLATGVKTSLGMGVFVSSSRSEIGFKIPVIYAVQKLEDPPGNYTVQEGNNIMTMAGIYSRWPVGSYFFQTEFSKYLMEDELLWSLGLGYKF
jgi:hypothetical protein